VTDSDDTIKQAFRRLASQNHPDREPDPTKKPGLEEKMKKITEAYRNINEVRRT
jgi:DnaJ-class molecular chaperone